MYNNQIIKKLKSRATLRKVVGTYIILRKSYRIQKRKKVSGYFGQCPFHMDKTPSFKLYRLTKGYSKGTWGCKCFGCGWSGDVFRFIQVFEDVDFGDAFKIVNEIRGSLTGNRNSNQLSFDFADVEVLEKSKFKKRLEPKGWWRMPVDSYGGTQFKASLSSTSSSEEDNLPF